ncbi:MAG: hypothetical protein HUJ56_12445, partial [Erysipelotrichaceae bacterium]|nr:hypothetical protein [Erysipelotrichaceae bacterium]
EAEENNARANQRIKNTVEQSLASSIHGYAAVHPEFMQLSVNDGKAHYALLPVWLLTTSWQGKQYIFAMNGQTGKMVGDLPADNAESVKTFGIIFAFVAALVYGLSWLL